MAICLDITHVHSCIGSRQNHTIIIGLSTINLFVQNYMGRLSIDLEQKKNIFYFNTRDAQVYIQNERYNQMINNTSLTEYSFIVIKLRAETILRKLKLITRIK